MLTSYYIFVESGQKLFAPFAEILLSFSEFANSTGGKVVCVLSQVKP
jgi:hypothetical protein